MKKILFIIILIAVLFINLKSVSNAEDNTALMICKEKQDACHATCEAETVRPIKKSRCKSRCDVSYHECRERELHEIDKKESKEGQ
ncbi:MAG: hypothetical protein AB1782_13580 [Cyanobacteriota bacterium]